MAAAQGTAGDVQPGEAMLADGLVDGQMQLPQQLPQAGIGLGAAGGDVGRLAQHMLAGGHAAHQAVEFGASVAAVDM